MGEPNSVAGDILQLCVMAGQKNNKPLVTPDQFKNLVLTDNVTFDGLSTQEFFDYTVPSGQILIVTFVSLAVSFLNGSDDAVSWNMGYSGTVTWYNYQNGIYTALSTRLYTLGYCNSPIFFVFMPGQTPKLRIQGAGATSADILLQARAQCYITDAALYNTFKRFETVGVRS